MNRDINKNSFYSFFEKKLYENKGNNMKNK